MDFGGRLMPAAPPALLVAIMSRVIPPASREAVLGDLWERYRSPGHFVRQGLAILPFLIVSEARRRSSWPIVGLQAFILFACLRGFDAAEAVPAPWLRAILPTLSAFVALAWHDAYRNGAYRNWDYGNWQIEPVGRPAWGEVAAVVVAIGLSQLLTGFLVATAGLPETWLLGGPELLSAASALPTLCLLRWGAAIASTSRVTGNQADLAREYERFRASVRWRNRLEIGAITVTLLIAGVILTKMGRPVPPMVGAILLGFLGLLAYLVRRGGAPVAHPGMSAEEVRRLFCRELLRQSRLRSLLVWWWLAPLFIGLAMNFLIKQGQATLDTRRIVGILLILALAACVGAFNAERARMPRRNARALQAAPPP